jgi:Bacterial dnaA protein helix-turn-helix
MSLEAIAQKPVAEFMAGYRARYKRPAAPVVVLKPVQRDIIEIAPIIEKQNPRPETIFFKHELLVCLVCEHFELTEKTLMSKNRYRHLVKARKALAVLLFEFTNFSLPHMGRFMGGRDHSTISHLLSTAMKDEEVVYAVDLIRGKLQ